MCTYTNIDMLCWISVKFFGICRTKYMYTYIKIYMYICIHGEQNIVLVLVPRVDNPLALVLKCHLSI